MVEVISLLVVLVLSLVITRVATVALALTGMAYHAARFQARSALTGAGFTTSESERVVNHPVRRRVIMVLMLTGNTGLVLVAALTVALVSGGDENGSIEHRLPQFVALLAGLIGLYFVARSTFFERILRRFIERVLSRHTDLAQRDFASLLRLGGDYRVVEIQIEEGDWIASADLAGLRVNLEGLLVLGITRHDGRYEGAPRGSTRIEAGDTVLIYGREESIAELDRRSSGVGGQLRHAEAIARESTAEPAEP